MTGVQTCALPIFINGTQIAEDIKREVATDVGQLKEQGILPGLAVILVGDDAASSAYVNMKARTCEQLGILSRKITLDPSLSTQHIVDHVRALNDDPSIDGILIQLPLPKHVSKHTVLESVDPAKDVDGFQDRKSTRLNSSHIPLSRMPSSA